MPLSFYHIIHHYVTPPLPHPSAAQSTGACTRIAAEDSEDGAGPAKRRRTSVSPSPTPAPADTDTDTRAIPVFAHTFVLCHPLPAHATAALIDLGAVHCTATHVVTSAGAQICARPPLPWPAPTDGDDAGDLWAALHILRDFGRVALSYALTLAPSSPNDDAAGALRLTLTAALLAPTIWGPVPLLPGPKRAAEVARRHAEDAQRRFCELVFPAPSSPPTSQLAHASGSTDIPFLYSALGPAPHTPPALDAAMQPPGLVPRLLPFQRRSVAWMLRRERAPVASLHLNEEGGDEEDGREGEEEGEEPPLFCVRTPAGWFNRLTGALSPIRAETEREHAREYDHGNDFGHEYGQGEDSRGGILAEEPGLGKTLEVLAAVLLHPRAACAGGPVACGSDEDKDGSDEDKDKRDKGKGKGKERAKAKARDAPPPLMDVKTTLIVTPPALAPQWADELARHAPALRVLVYDGWAKAPFASSSFPASSAPSPYSSSSTPSSSSSSPHPSSSSSPRSSSAATSFAAHINAHDIVITTYATLRGELAVARAPPVRPRRTAVVYGPRGGARSGLVRVRWWRVVMDEVQAVGAGKVEEMVSLIPRVSSWAVSGTPARAQVADLKHVLKFLRIDHLVEPPRVWARLLTPRFASQFAELFRRVSIRTLKSAVKDELTIPAQTRFLVPVALGPVERHIYDQALEAALLELGLDARGVAASAGWEPDAGALRTALRRLRGLCTHPQVGQLHADAAAARRLGRGGGEPKSIGAVLAGMRAAGWRALMDDRKARVLAGVRKAQLQQHGAGRARYQDALATLLGAEAEAGGVIAEVGRALAEHAEAGAALKAADVDEGGKGRARDGDDGGKGKARDAGSEADSEEGDVPQTPAGLEHAAKGRALRQRLREARVVLHRVKFLQGDVYHVLGGAHAAAEDRAYADAEEIRRDLLKTTEDGATRAMAVLVRDAAAKGLTRASLLLPVPFLGMEGGEKCAELIEEANEIVANLLNAQSELLWEWRDRMHALLTASLKTDEADGDEYAKSLDSQGEADVYLQAYTFLMADRRAALIAERTLLAEHDGKEKKLRKTKAAQDAAAAAAELQVVQNPDLPEDFELRPEHEVLFKDLTTARRDLLEAFEGKAIKSIVCVFRYCGVALAHLDYRVELNAINVTLKDTHREKNDVVQALTSLRKLIVDQSRVMEKLEVDVAQFRKAFNERILYFRQLQEISDSVAEVTWDHSVTEAIEQCDQEKQELEVKINTNRARQRFLDHLAKNTQDGGTGMDEDDDGCILCRCEFQRGYITPCAHIFCEPCMNAWILKKDGKTCPVCRVLLKPEQLQRFSAQDQKPEAPVASSSKEPAPKLQRDIEYNKIDPHLLESIQTMDSLGSYGSKIEVLVQHLLYLQVTDPGAKSIVFSAWADSLHNIPCLKIDQSKGGQNGAKRFVSDPNLLVLLLHGERENAGLNITCASRVFLVESVVHHGFEVQAIARIDRMGQTRPTEVYCYYAEDTVEKNILDLAARQGLSLYTKDNSAGTLNTAAFALDVEKKTDSPSKKKKVQKGDFIFKTDDMLAILFPHMYFYEDYMDTSEDSQVTANELTQNGPSQSQEAFPVANAVAGPSRLA
ncbi:hypothetical protein HWV62_13783 [Athelia sp. TMB]|nr:hypothetical protein HWV62_13783 [Athelia sp. TMB]